MPTRIAQPRTQATGSMKPPRWLRILLACALCLLLHLPPHMAQATEAMHGLPLLRHFGIGDLPAVPAVPGLAQIAEIVDRGDVIVGDDELRGRAAR